MTAPLHDNYHLPGGHLAAGFDSPSVSSVDLIATRCGQPFLRRRFENLRGIPFDQRRTHPPRTGLTTHTTSRDIIVDMQRSFK